MGGTLAVDPDREIVKYHVGCAAILAGLMALVAVTFSVSSAETKTTYVCLGDVWHCAVSEVSGWGQLCGWVGTIASVACVLWAWQWFVNAPKNQRGLPKSQGKH
jgi:hypothetical protein